MRYFDKETKADVKPSLKRKLKRQARDIKKFPSEGKSQEGKEEVYVIGGKETLRKRYKFKTRGKFKVTNMDDFKDKEAEEEESKGPDPFPGPAPIPIKKFQRHNRGEGIRVRGVKTKLWKKKWHLKDQQMKWTAEQAARTEILLTESAGFLQPGKGEDTSEILQTDIAESVDITSATKRFDLHLPQFGPYRISYTRNGRYLVIGGRQGHVAAIDWVTKRLLNEMNVMESVHDVQWFHNENMYAVAQKEWVYVYDSKGVELHCLKALDRVLRMEFLPYHFLLAASNERGYLSWLDVSIGKMVSQFNSRSPHKRLDVLCQNPQNAVICLGHPNGTVSMWTPNVKEPVAKMLCHLTAVKAVAVDPKGMYMATSGTDRSLKIWDVRTFKCLQNYKVGGTGASELQFSQRGLLAASLGNVVEIYKDSCRRTVRKPYLCHRHKHVVTGLEFCPYEDVLGVGHSQGFMSLLIPGAGEPNFDALESNPFQSKAQRREAEVKALLEKIQPDLITLDPGELGEVDTPTLGEKMDAKKKLLYVKVPEMNLTHRKRKGKVGKVREEVRQRLIKEKRQAVPEEKKEPEETIFHPLNRFRPKSS